MSRVSDRFGVLWNQWDARIEAGESPATILASAREEDLIEILGGESEVDRKYARDIIATALLNRLYQRNRDIAASMRNAATAAAAAQQAAEVGRQAIEMAALELEEEKSMELHDEVYRSAKKSLDATQAAFDAARLHAETLRAALATARQGRLGPRLNEPTKPR